MAGLSTFLEIILTGALLFIIVANAAHLLDRYFGLRAALPWIHEMSRFLLVWIVFLGGVVVTIERDHISFTAEAKAVGWIDRKYIALFRDLVAAVTTGLLAYSAVPLFREHMGIRTATLGIPHSFLGAAVSTGALLMLLACIANGVNSMTTQETDAVNAKAE